MPRGHKKTHRLHIYRIKQGIGNVIRKMLKRLLRNYCISLSLDWRKKQDTRADVKVTIQSFLFSKLPGPTYTEQDCAEKTEAVYMHIFDSYMDRKNSVYAMA
ncbi:hypothetical protein KKF55_06385 [Patescibacteria group bacterium]|nr:hypothetical protein [Patescibacteria group bacterium]